MNDTSKRVLQDRERIPKNEPIKNQEEVVQSIRLKKNFGMGR